MKNKKLLIAGASVASLAALGLGAFAFFGDVVELEEQHAKVGTVELSGTIEMKHTQVKRNRILNPFGAIYGEEDDDAEGHYPYYPEGMSSTFMNNSIQKLSHHGPSSIDTRADILNAFEVAPDNLNPGDNTYLPGGELNHGTDHEIIVNVTNEGSKSVQTRMLFEVSGTDADGNALTADDLRYIKLYFDEMNSISGLTSIHDGNFVNAELFTNRILLPEISASETNVIYDFSSDLLMYSVDRSQTEYGSIMLNELSDAVFSGLVLSGNTSHENREIENAMKYYYLENEEDSWVWDLNNEKIEAPVSGSFKFDIAMESGFVYDDYEWEYQFDEAALEAIQRLQNADIQIKVTILGIQYRNTGDPIWEVLFSQDFNL